MNSQKKNYSSHVVVIDGITRILTPLWTHSLLLENQRSETSSKVDNPTSTLLSMDLDIFSRSLTLRLKDKLKGRINSTNHPYAERCYPFDFPSTYCMAGPLRTHCSFSCKMLRLSSDYFMLLKNDLGNHIKTTTI